MKLIYRLILVVSVSFSLAACSAKSESGKKSDAPVNGEQSPVQKPGPSPVPGPTQRPALETVYENSSEPVYLTFIESANHSLDLEIYQMSDEGILKALADALTRGVRIRVIQDTLPKPSTGDCVNPDLGVFSHVLTLLGVSSLETKAGCNLAYELMQKIKQSPGGRYELFNKKNLCAPGLGNCYQHGKLIIADENRAVMSTGNLNSTNLCSSLDLNDKCNRDYAYVTGIPKNVASLKEIFENDLKEIAYDVPSYFDESELTVSPYSLTAIVNFIDSAQKTLEIQNQYLKNPEMNDAIARAAQRGVKVQVNVTGACAFGKPDAAKIREFNQVYGAFDQAGVISRMFTKQVKIKGHPGYLHAKTMVADGVRAWVGSINGSTTALKRNREFGIFFNESRNVQKLRKQMLEDLSHPMATTWQESLNCKNE